MKGVLKMKRSLWSIVLVAVLAFTLAGCGNNADMGGQYSQYYNSADNSLKFLSYEGLTLAKEEAAANGYKEDLNNLEGLEYYYVPAYAENNWEFTVGYLYVISNIVEYNKEKPEDTYQLNEFLLWMSREENGEESLEYYINPPIPYEGSPKPWTVEGIYYTEPIYSGSFSTYFYWVQDNCFCMLRISENLMDEIREKDPEALKGPLFELKKVELKTEPK